MLLEKTQTQRNEKNSKNILGITYLGKMILTICINEQRIDFVSFPFRKRNIFNVSSLGLTLEANKYSCILGNVMVCIRSNLVTIRVYFDCPVVVKFIESHTK